MSAKSSKSSGDFTFDEDTHEYRVDGRIVPSVTQVLADLLPQWKAGEWYLQRGRAIHRGCALICKSRRFRNDPRIDGPLEACRKFLEQTKGTIVAVEKPMFSPTYLFAGTLDLSMSAKFSVNHIVPKNDLQIIIDWKRQITLATVYQLAFYGILAGIGLGVAVELRDDGAFKMGEVHDLRPFKQAALGMLTVYNLRKKLKLTEENQNDNAQ